MAKTKVAQRNNSFPFSHTLTYTRSTPADGETFENTFNEYDNIINFLKDSLMEEIQRESTPIGSYILGAIGINDPRYVLCDGRELNRSEFPLLNEALEILNYPYGAGDGSTTFNIPNLTSDERFFRSSKEDLSNLGQVQEDSFQGHGIGTYHDSSGFVDNPYFLRSGARGRKPALGTNSARYTYVEGLTFPQGNVDENLFKPIINDGENGNPRISNETRPKNISAAVYIKVK